MNLSDPLLSPKNDSSLQKFEYKSAIYLLMFTIALESAGTILLKRAFDNYTYMITAYICYFLSLSLFSVVLQHISLSIAYTTWCTLGTVSVCLMSKIFYDENISFSKGICIVLTIPCVIGMYILP